MTPELRTACEVVFQEHKTSHDPINWKKDAFRGRISLGLSEMAKETLVSEKVIYFPNRAKKIVTVLNPAVAKAASFEEAAAMVKSGNFSPVQLSVDAQPLVVTKRVIKETPKHFDKPMRVVTDRGTTTAGIRWYMKPVFYYVVWPLCAAIVCVAISYLLGSVDV
jgi:hypothetical protein